MLCSCVNTSIIAWSLDSTSNSGAGRGPSPIPGSEAELEPFPALIREDDEDLEDDAEDGFDDFGDRVLRGLEGLGVEEGPAEKETTPAFFSSSPSFAS